MTVFGFVIQDPSALEFGATGRGLAYLATVIGLVVLWRSYRSGDMGR